MTRNSRQHGAHASSAKKAAELAIAAPLVIAHRLTRAATAGYPLSARDRKEFTGMVVEKQLAFSQAWFAAWQGAVVAQMELSSWAWRHAGAIAHASLQPVHAKATSNARRLSRSTRRRR